MTDTPLAKHDSNLIWIDLEMTGLYPDRDRIIEIAVVVTDAQITTRVEGPVFAIHQSDATLDAMDAWNKGTHGKSPATACLQPVRCAWPPRLAPHLRHRLAR